MAFNSPITAMLSCRASFGAGSMPRGPNQYIYISTLPRPMTCRTRTTRLDTGNVLGNESSNA